MRFGDWLRRLLFPGSRGDADARPDSPDTNAPEPDESWTRPTAEDIGFEGITSRFTDDPDVQLDESRIPPELRHLVPYAKHWCIGDDVERGDLMLLTPPEELSSFVAAVWPLRQEIERWCDSQREAVPVPVEILVFDQMMEAFAEAVALYVDAPDENA